MQRIKVLHIMAGAEHGGAEAAFVDTCLAMHESGFFDVGAVLKKHKYRVKRLEDAGIKVHTVPFGGGLDFVSYRKIKRIIADARPDIVQPWMARASKRTPNRRKNREAKPYLVVSRVGGYYKLKNFRNTDYFIAVTPGLVDYLEEIGVSPDRIKQINNFVDFVEPGSDVESIDRAEFDTPKNATLLLMLARLHENKAVDIAIRAMVDLPDAYLWIAGEGELRSVLEELASDLGVADRVRFLGWRNDRAELFKTADICVFCSRQEPFGNVFAQSWASKTPLIVSDAEGPSYFCVDGEDCLMVPKDDAGAIVQAVRRLSGDSVLQMTLVNNAYQKYMQQFTKEITMKTYLDFYSEILEKEGVATKG